MKQEATFELFQIQSRHAMVVLLVGRRGFVLHCSLGGGFDLHAELLHYLPCKVPRQEAVLQTPTSTHRVLGQLESERGSRQVDTAMVSSMPNSTEAWEVNM